MQLKLLLLLYRSTTYVLCVCWFLFCFFAFGTNANLLYDVASRAERFANVRPFVVKVHAAAAAVAATSIATAVARIKH